MKHCVKSVTTPILGSPFPTPDPFLFCVYHKDSYPAGDEAMQAPRKGNGMDFDPSAPYRMYHGRRIPGFPQHPHRGFETITATVEGTIDHSDSMGNAGRYGGGDLQWMTAGSGIVHAEMFPLIHQDKSNTLRLFQIWLNLPKAGKMVTPAFKMHWADDIPVLDNGAGARVRMFAGTLEGRRGLAPPPDSWAAKPESDVGIWLLELQPGARYTLPVATNTEETNRSAYYVEGKTIEVGGRVITDPSMLELRVDTTSEFVNTGDIQADILVLQGRPIGEPVAQHGPFVMNTRDEIEETFREYRATQFGGWPWPQDAMVFPRNKGRFALFNGLEETPQ